MTVGLGGATSDGEQVVFSCVVLSSFRKLGDRVCELACLSFHVLLNEMKVGISGA